MTAAGYAIPRGGAGPSESDVRTQLHRVGSSPQFARSPRLIRLLHYLVEHSLSGDERELLEYAVGVEVFDRGADFDPNRDTIVRVTARRLRERLRAYYAGPGCDDPLHFEMPLGHYRIEFTTFVPPRPTRYSWRLPLLGIALGCLVATGWLVWRLAPGSPEQFLSLPGVSQPAHPAALPDSEASQARVLEQRARYLLDRRAPGDLPLARDIFRQALVLDSGLADAWSGLASTLRLLGLDEWQVEPGKVIAFEAAVAAALNLEPDHPEANARMATAMYLRGRYAESSEYFLRALDARSPLAVGMLAGMQRSFGRHELALANMRRAEALAPLNYTNRWNLAVYLMERGHLGEAEARLQQLLLEYPAHSTSIKTELARALLLQRRTADAETLLIGLPNTPTVVQARVVAAEQKSDLAQRDRWLAVQTEDMSEEGRLHRIEALAYVGMEAEAIRELAALYHRPEGRHRLSSAHQHWLNAVKNSPFTRALHDHPRWLELLGRQDEPLPMERGPELQQLVASLGL